MKARGHPGALTINERYPETPLGPLTLTVDGLTVGAGRARIRRPDGELVWSSADLPCRAALELGRSWIDGLIRDAPTGPE